MPLYEYECQVEGNRFEVIQKFSDAPLTTCPTCGGPVRRLISSPAIQFKGSGWYITDYARKGPASSDKGASSDKDGSSAKSNGNGSSSGGSSSGSASSSSGTSTSSSSSESSKSSSSSGGGTSSTSSSN
jgi:putative FmdB family regulatory protein